MNVELLDLLRLVLSFGSLALIIFAVGAYIGWRSASRTAEHPSTWLFLLGELSWLPLIATQFLLDHPPGWDWMRWLPPVVLVLWGVAFGLRVRHRRGTSA